MAALSKMHNKVNGKQVLEFAAKQIGVNKDLHAIYADIKKMLLATSHAVIEYNNQISKCSNTEVFSNLVVTITRDIQTMDAAADNINGQYLAILDTIKRYPQRIDSYPKITTVHGHYLDMLAVIQTGILPTYNQIMTLFPNNEDGLMV